MMSLERELIDHKCHVEFILWGQLIVDQLTDQRTDITLFLTTHTSSMAQTYAADVCA